MKNLNISMSIYKTLNIPKGKAICYSGFRPGQQPNKEYPSYQEVKEDLLLLEKHWKYLRLYDCDPHAETLLEVIQKEKLDFKVYLGAYIVAEENNPNCPWHGGVFSEEILKNNVSVNDQKIKKLIEITQKYRQHIFAVSVGNEAAVDWTDHMVSTERITHFVREIKKSMDIAVSYCDNYFPWLNKLEKLANELDFISIHTYPFWESKSIKNAMDFTLDNYSAVSQKYPNIPVIISEAGWATKSNGYASQQHEANEENQSIYLKNFNHWAEKESIMGFFFEAFDEMWKGSPELNDPEKYWGLFDHNRSPKKAMKMIENNFYKYKSYSSNQFFNN